MSKRISFEYTQKMVVVRFTIAMLAAMAVHAFVFFVFYAQPKLKLSSAPGVMQISFLSAESKLGTDNTKPAKVAHESMNKADRPVEKPQMPRQAVAVISIPTTMQSHVQASQPAIQMNGATITPAELEKNDSPSLANLPEEPMHSSDDMVSNSHMGAVPKGIQQQLLVNLTYPKLARRHGWQGRAEFELRIYKQGVDKLTLLASTGFPILDQAAERGLALVRDIPLSNGLYHMPVVFELR